MKGSTIVAGVVLAFAMSASIASFAQDAAGQVAKPEAAAGDAVAGQTPGAEAVSGGPGAVLQTQVTTRSSTIVANGSSPNIQGAACPATFKMISGACHPFYNDHVTIINQFPDIAGNTWRCGFKNNTGATVTVYIYTLCAKE